MAQAESKAEADRFGCSFLEGFSESIEIDTASRAEAEEFWGVRTVRVVHKRLDPQRRTTAKIEPTGATTKRFVVWGPELPEEVVEDNCLTNEDHAALTLDHIRRTCPVVEHLQIRKWAL